MARIITFEGYSGSGKSTHGLHFAKVLGVPSFLSVGWNENFVILEPSIKGEIARSLVPVMSVVEYINKQKFSSSDIVIIESLLYPIIALEDSGLRRKLISIYDQFLEMAGIERICSFCMRLPSWERERRLIIRRCRPPFKIDAIEVSGETDTESPNLEWLSNNLEDCYLVDNLQSTDDAKKYVSSVLLEKGMEI